MSGMTKEERKNWLDWLCADPEEGRTNDQDAFLRALGQIDHLERQLQAAQSEAAGSRRAALEEAAKMCADAAKEAHELYGIVALDHERADAWLEHCVLRDMAGAITDLTKDKSP